MKNSSNGFGLFLLGTAVGAALGILLAPDAGEQTREMLADKAKDSWDQVKEKVSAGQDKLEGYAAEAKNYTKDAASEAGSKLDQYAGDAKSYTDKAANDTKSNVKQGADELNDKIQDA